MIRFIGDVHANFAQYKQIADDFAGKSIQVGDFGVGFAPVPELEPRQLFIRGNHDNPVLCRDRNMPWADNFLEDGTLLSPWTDINKSIFCIGGALSIDRHLRTEGLNWWHDEELSCSSFVELIVEYTQIKPDVMVTHDCPDNIAKVLFPNQLLMHSITRNALQVMLGEHQPKIWIFGHWHQSVDVTINGTRFICLNELEYKDLEV